MISAVEIVGNSLPVDISNVLASQTAFTLDSVSGVYKVKSVTVRFGTASSSGTLQIEVAASGTALGSGTNLLSSTVSLAGTANTTLSGAVKDPPAALITAGSAVNIVLGGTLTSLANCSVSIFLEKVA